MRNIDGTLPLPCSVHSLTLTPRHCSPDVSLPHCAERRVALTRLPGLAPERPRSCLAQLCPEDSLTLLQLIGSS